MAVITITREPGSLGEEAAARLAGHLGFSLVDKARLAQLAGEMDLDEARRKVDEVISGESPIDSETEACAGMLRDILVLLAEEQDLVIIGRGAQGLFCKIPGTLHVRFIAPRKFRVQQVQTHERLSEREARRRIRTLEIRRARYLRLLSHLNPADPNLYDLTLRMDRLSIEQALKLIETAIDSMGLRQVPRDRIVKDLLPEPVEKRDNGAFCQFR